MAAEERDFEGFYYAIPEEVFPRGTQYFTDTFELAVSKCAPETLCFDHLLISFWPELSLPDAAHLTGAMETRIKQDMI